jgi:hypothetical protein
MKPLLFTFSLLFLVGCGTSNGKNSDFTISAGKKSENLGTLSIENLDLKETLYGKNWNKITMDLDKFYTTSISTVEKVYKIDMNFKDGKVLAYADCQKITAQYRVKKDEIKLSHAQYETFDKPSCEEFKDADQAIYQFMNNSFEATKITKNEITFKSYDFDTEIKIERD